MVYILRFFSLKNAVCFVILTYLVPVLFAFYIQGVLKLKKNNSGAESLTAGQISRPTSTARFSTKIANVRVSFRRFPLLVQYNQPSLYSYNTPHLAIRDSSGSKLRSLRRTN